MKIKRSDIKAFAAELIREVMEKGKTLHAFDLDDTLIKSSSKVIVKTPEGIKKLTPAEYAIYTPSPTDELDFSEFNQIKNPSLIKDNVKIFLDALRQSSSMSKTIILTARTPDITKDIQHLLDFKNLPQVEIHAVGSSDPQKKADVIQDFINQGFTQIRFFDDSPANIKAVNNLRPTNPDVDIRTKLVVNALDEIRKQNLNKEIVEPALEKDVDPKELQMGIEVEMEHTDSKKEAKVIALQHLAEDPRYYTKLKSLNLEDIHEPVKPGILKKRLGKLSCTKVREERAKLKDKGTHYAKALQRYLNYHCQD
jgi:hypothetical protein